MNSSPIMDLLHRRQSCRKFKENAPVPAEQLRECLEAARLAPSACNSQPWRFHVVDGDPLRAQLAETAAAGIYKMNKFIRHAPVLVAVERLSSTAWARLGGAVRGVPYHLIDLGVACTCFELRAAEQGLGVCWLGWFDESAVRRLLGLPRGTKLDLLLAVGQPEDPALRPKLRKELSAVAKFYSSAPPADTGDRRWMATGP